MEGWLYGLFALLGVLAGGLFTYLGMKKQLEQQSKLDSRRWRRKVRSEPLLKLRDELARMAFKHDKLIATVNPTITNKTEEEVKKEGQGAIDDFNAYLSSGDYAQTLFMQDAEIWDKAEEIRKDYKESFYAHLFPNLVDAEEMKKAMGVSERNKARIIDVQELINKRLEEL